MRHKPKPAPNRLGTALARGRDLLAKEFYGFRGTGAGLAESMMMVVAAINVHHFIVDRYIWKLRGTSNSKTLADRQTTAAVPAAG